MAAISPIALHSQVVLAEGPFCIRRVVIVDKSPQWSLINY